MWMTGGVLLGLAIHLLVILVLPRFASDDVWARVEAMGAPSTVHVLDPVESEAENPLGLDPALAYAICRLNLADGPGALTGVLPDAFWSVSVIGRDGISIYSTTHRSSAEDVLNLGIFNPAQTRLLAESDSEAANRILVVQSESDDVFVAIRVAPPHPEMLPRYRRVLESLTCSNSAL